MKPPGSLQELAVGPTLLVFLRLSIGFLYDFRISYKILSIACKALHDLAPSYSCDLLVTHSSSGSSHLSSAPPKDHKAEGWLGVTVQALATIFPNLLHLLWVFEQFYPYLYKACKNVSFGCFLLLPFHLFCLSLGCFMVYWSLAFIVRVCEALSIIVFWKSSE